MGEQILNGLKGKPLYQQAATVVELINGLEQAWCWGKSDEKWIALAKLVEDFAIKLKRKFQRRFSSLLKWAVEKDFELLHFKQDIFGSWYAAAGSEIVVPKAHANGTLLVTPEIGTIYGVKFVGQVPWGTMKANVGKLTKLSNKRCCNNVLYWANWKLLESRLTCLQLLNWR